MSEADRERLSKFMSLVLRHQPEVAGLTLDERGFVAVDDLLRAARQKVRADVTREEVEALCAPSDDPEQKTRFELEGDYIRAGHGHSVPISTRSGYRPCVPERPLFHATTRAALEAIRETGLRAMSRQKVHLSYDRAITLEAARRRSRDVEVVEVDVAAARAAGVKFYESADPRIVLSDDVPARCLRLP